MTRELVCVDFETFGIDSRPMYPPEPVGVSLKRKGTKAEYLAWGHPIENNCTKEQAVKVLQGLWKDSNVDLLFHNAKFDLAVAWEKLGLAIPEWSRIHDTLFLLFLHNPYMKTFSLKPVAETLLGMRSSERDAVMDWLIEHQPVPGTRITAKNWGAFIAYAPGKLVGKYADGDTTRTFKLFNLLHKEIKKRGMEEAYQRELRLLPILMRNEAFGMRVDLDALAAGVDDAKLAMERVENWIRKRLKAPGLNISSGDQLALALYDAGVVTEFNSTKTGKPSVSKDSLTLDMFKDPKVYHALGYRGKLETVTTVFMEPWLRVAEVSGGRIFTRWNQVRSHGGGTVTGRLSSSPNFQNIAKGLEERKDEDYVFPSWIKDLPHLPKARGFIIADKGQLLIDRDFSQQEIRIAAHFEDGPLMEAFHLDPRFDLHSYVERVLINDFDRDIGRDRVKKLNFGILYGMGTGGVSKALGIDAKEARDLIKAQKTAIPGIVELDAKLKEMARNGESMRTWGGREYFCEPPAMTDGYMRTFEYKMLNTLIQGSAADCTKQAMINYDERKKEGTLLASIHDELLAEAPRKAAKAELKIMHEAMMDMAFDVPMLSSGKMGASWGTLEKVKEK